MPLSSVTRVSDGIQKQYDFDFGYLRKSHIFVFVNDQLRSFKWLGPFQIELLNFPQPDDRVTIRRLTDRANRITTFTDGQTILAEDLNAADLQTFYIAQEMLDQIEERILAGEVSVIGSGYITAQWIQEQLEANIAGSAQFQAVSDAIDNEALERANALAAEAAARAAEIAAEAATRGAAIFDLEQADLEAGQRLDVLEADVNDATTGIKARIGTLETVTVDLENNKADASVVSAIQAAVDAAEAQIVTIDEALASETAARTSQISAANSRIDGAEADITGLQVTVTSLETGKAEASDLAALTARVGTAEAAIVTESSARASADTAAATALNSLVARISNEIAMNRNPRFSQEYSPAGPPPGWTTFNGGGRHSSANSVGSPTRRLMYVANGDATDPIGIYQDMTGIVPGRKIVIRGSARRRGGDFRATGIYVQFLNSSNDQISAVSIPFGTTRSLGGSLTFYPDGQQTWEKVTTIPSGTNTIRLFALTTWSPLGASAVPVEIDWYECSLAYVEDAAAGVSELREALTTGSTSIARLLLAVNTATNAATIEAAAFEGDGVWNGSAITLQANLIKLLAQDIQFGSRTQFEDGRGTIYNTEAGKRLRLLGPFGASNDLVLWYGNSSVALQSETKTNGVFAIATDGRVYFGNEPQAPSLKIAASSPRSDIRFGGGSRGVSVTITPTGGTAPYTYSHELTAYSGNSGIKPSLNNATSQTYGVTAPASGAGTEVVAAVTTTVTDADGRQAQATFSSVLSWSV